MIFFRYLRYLIGIVLLFAATTPVEAHQSLRSRTYGVRNGLPSHNVSAIAQDDNGILWIATWNGIAFFDGYEFTNFRSGSRRGALSSNRIIDIVPDTAGHVWVLTFDRNLYVFDIDKGRFENLRSVIEQASGQSFVSKGMAPIGDHIWALGAPGSVDARIHISNPTDPDSMEIFDVKRLDPKASEIIKVEVDSYGNEWLFTDTGVQLYGTDLNIPGKVKFQQAMQGGYTYLVAADGTPYRYKKGDSSPTRMERPDGLFRVNDLKAYDDTHMLGATNAGLMVYDCKLNKVNTLPVNGPLLEIDDINVDSKGRIWALAKNGKVILHENISSPGDVLAYAPLPPDPTRSNHTIWLEDRFGNVWLSPENEVFGYYDEATRRIVPSPIRSELVGNASIPLLELSFVDNQKNLWVSSAHNLTAVSFHDEDVRRAYPGGNDDVRSICRLANGTFLLGTASGAIARFDSEGHRLGYLHRRQGGASTSQSVESASPEPFSQRVYAMKQDLRHNLWIGTKGDGLFIVSPSGMVTNYRANPSDPYSLPCDSIYHFDQDNLGNMWIATYGGGLLLAQPANDGSYRFIGARNDLKKFPIKDFERVRRITHNSDGTMIAATTNGIVTFSNKFSTPSDIEFHTSRHIAGDTTSLVTDNVMQTLVASDGTLYVLPQGEHLQRIPASEALRSNLHFENLNTGNSPHSILNATNSFGNALSMVETKDEKIIIVFESAMVVYDPATGDAYTLAARSFDHGTEFTEAEPVIDPITGNLWVGSIGYAGIVSPENKAVNSHVPRIVVTGVQFEGESEKQMLLNPDCIVVPPGIHSFSISFAALDYPENSSIQYAYRINGESNWTYIDNANTIYINRLEPGLHRVQVRSTNSDGIWQDNIRNIDILCKPTFGESVWASLLIALAVIVVIFALVYLYMLYRKSQLMKVVHRKEHDFFIEASHRLRTPLTLIGSPVTEVLENEQLSETGREHLNKVRRNAYEMLELVNSMLKRGFNDDDLVDDENAGAYITPGATESIPQAEASIQQTPQQSDSRTSILIVEDNKDLREFLHDILSAQYNVIEAPNGKIGLEKAEKLQPDFIITDVTMPEMDGLTMVHNIKQNKALSHIPIIVLSAKASIQDRVQGLNEGIDDYITKPFSATYLRQRIASIIAQRGLLQQSYFEKIGQTLNSPAADAPAPEGDNKGTPAEPAPTAPQEYRLESPSITDADQEMMAKLLKYIESRISDENLKIEELADAVNMGRTVFYGKIKALVGMSPSDFVRKLRLQRAEELVARSKMNFSQIAYNIGFSDPKYFTKCFKKETGMTPSEYRQKSAQ